MKKLKKENLFKKGSKKEKKINVDNPNNNAVKTKKKFRIKKDNIMMMLKIFLIIIIIVILAVVTAGIIFIASIIKNAPEFDPKNLYQQESTIIYDANGQMIAKIGNEKREKIAFEDMAEVLIDAIIATEDSRFFIHNGFDLPRFAKASFGQAMGQDAGGASTLTMQISKNSVTDKKFNKAASGLEGIKRKFTDIYMSIFKIEKNYTKKEIFEFYANYNFLGGTTVINNGAYGVEQACLTYFGKHAKDVNLAEAAMIAGLFQAPNAYDPYLDPEAAEERRRIVLQLMEDHGYITEEERLIAREMTIDKLILKEHESQGGEYQQFIDMVVQDVIDMYAEEGLEIDPYDTPMEIWTTMDRTKQDHVNSVMQGVESPVTGNTYEWQNDRVQAGIAVIDVNTGAIVAIGGKRNNDGLRQYNYATMIKKHIGSTAKPLYDYGPGIEFENWSTYTLFGDEPHAYSSGLRIDNWNYTYNGILTLREAVMGSWNIPALKAFQANNRDNIDQFVRGLGLSPDDKDGLYESHALGGYEGECPLSLAAAYAAFANGGYYIKPYSFTKIVFRDSDEVYNRKIQKTRAMGEDTAYMISSVLVSTATSALGRYSYVNGVTFGAKTGTSNFPQAIFDEYNLPNNAVNDIWVAGITPQYSIAVWYGYDQVYEDYYNVISSGQNSRIFKAVAEGIFTEDIPFDRPSSVVSVTVERDTNPAKLPSEFTPDDLKVTELFKRGTEPTEVSTRYSKLDNVSNLKAEIKDNKKVVLTWDGIATPDAINPEYIKKLLSSIFQDEGTLQKEINARLEYNQGYIGEVGYNVYRKTSSGEEFLGFTKDKTFTTSFDNDKKDTDYTYIVKTCYSIFKANMSDGKSVTVKHVADDYIEIELAGKETIDITVGQKYTDQSVTIKENGKDVTKTAVTSKNPDITIVRKSDNKTLNSFSDIDINKPDTYKITYVVTYKGEEKVLTRTVNYVAKTNTNNNNNSNTNNNTTN